MPAQMIPPTKDELMAFVPKMNEANQEEMRALLADPEFKALSENEQAEASIQALLFAYFTEQRFKDEADEADEDDDDDSVCEWCEKHEQKMWKDGLKCGGCLEDERNR